MITKYKTEAEYNAAKPFKKNTVALIEEANEVKMIGINVETKNPQPGDALFLDSDGNKVYLKGGDQLVYDLIPSDYTFVGVVFNNNGKDVGVIAKNAPINLKWCDYLEYTISAITGTNIIIELRLPPDYNIATKISVELDSSEINLEAADKINAAIESTFNGPDTEEADKIKIDGVLLSNLLSARYEETTVGENTVKTIKIQLDVWKDYRLYLCSGTNCTIKFTTWIDEEGKEMHVSTQIMRVNGIKTNYGLYNYQRFYANYSNRSYTTVPTAPLTDANILNKNDFETHDNAVKVREVYGTYENYLRSSAVLLSYKVGAFRLPSAEEMTEKYAGETFTTKLGETKYKFPALHYPTTLNSTYQGIQNWTLPSIKDLGFLMKDDILELIIKTLGIMKVTSLANNLYIWSALRCDVSFAWFFYGYAGTLGSGAVYSTSQAWVVSHVPFST